MVLASSGQVVGSLLRDMDHIRFASGLEARSGVDGVAKQLEPTPLAPYHTVPSFVVSNLHSSAAAGI